MGSLNLIKLRFCTNFFNFTGVDLEREARESRWSKITATLISALNIFAHRLGTLSRNNRTSDKIFL